MTGRIRVSVIHWLLLAVLWAAVLGMLGAVGLKDGRDFGDPGCAMRVVELPKKGY